MDLLKILYTSSASVVILFILTKIIGNKQMSQLNMFDYITGITIGSIAAEMATALDGDMLEPMLAMFVYALISLVISYASRKSLVCRRFLSGKSIVLYCDGIVFRKNIKKVRLNISDLLTQCRINGYFNLSDVDSIYIEEDGKLSVLPKSSARPLTPSDMSMQPDQEKPATCLILDGKVLFGNLKFVGKNLAWLNDRLHEQGYGSVKEVILATCDKNLNVSVYKVNDSVMDRDIYQ